MEAIELKSEAEGTSQHPRVKLKSSSRAQSHGQLGVVSESHLVKCSSSDKKNERKKQKQKQKKHVSRLQTGADTSEANMAGGSDSHPVRRKRFKLKRVNEVSFSWVRRANDDATQQQTSRGCTHGQYNRSRVTTPSLDAMVKRVLLKHADTALQSYGKSQDVEFEILEVLDSFSSKLRLPESESSKLWVHISFIAKPKNAESIDFSPKHFFGELFQDARSGKYHATYCSTFQPSDDPGHNHDCIFCPPGWKFHPADGCLVGRPPWYVQKYKLV